MKKLLFINGLIFVLLIFISELILGDWKKTFFKLNHLNTIPTLIKDRTITYDAKEIYGVKDSVIITYIRDKEGYRSKSNTNEKKIILTIGGSTTDQRYVSEGETWQDYLDKLIPKYDFINGGLDGQSTFGHLVSIKNWHSLDLKNHNVHGIMYYIGANDGRLLNEKLNSYDRTENTLSLINSTLNNNSFFYKKIKKIRAQVKAYISYKNGRFTNAAHKRRKIDFLNENKGVYFKVSNEKKYPYYEELFRNLLNKSLASFPEVKVFVVQQQLPGCVFNSENDGYDLHPYNDKDLISRTNNTCRDLAAVFLAQNKVLREKAFSKNVFQIPMYLDKIIDKNDVYDYVHTTNLGSKKISEYLKSTNLIK